MWQQIFTLLSGYKFFICYLNLYIFETESKPY